MARRKYANKKEYLLANKAQTIERQRARVAAAIQEYGGKCACCGEDEVRFLTLDHSRQDGAEFRKEHKIPGGSPFAWWLEKMGWPKDLGIQVLCANCHLAKDYRGGCPHSGKFSPTTVGRKRTRLELYK